MRIKTKFILSMAGAFILGIILTGSFCKFTMGNGTAGFNSDSKFDEIKSYIDAYYLNDYEDQDLKEGAYRGYVEGLGDPYSNYMTESEVETWEIETTGSYSGVGMTFSTDYENGFRVFSVVEDSPAEKAGVVEGDHILGVDGEKYTDGDKMASNIRGKEGTEVTVTISHDGKVKDYTMVREEIVQKSVSHKMGKDKIGYIEIDSFIDSTDEDFKSALDDLERQGAKALVLDLRNNGGGLVNEAVNVADEFLDKGVVCYVEDKNGNTETYNAVDGKTKLKTVVLVNENSASASEILAGALKDNGFDIVGTKTYGKGVIQTTLDLKDGSALKLTFLQYLSPNKNKINKVGIKPTVKVKDVEKTEKDEQLDKAKSLLR